MIRLVIADDQDLVRAGLRAILARHPDLDVVAEAADGAEAAEQAARHKADLVLMDLEMPGTDGLAGIALVQRARPAARVVVLTMFDLDDYVYEALRAGASGFLLKTTPPDDLVRALRTVSAGGMLFAPEVTRRLVESYVGRNPTAARPNPGMARLTEREEEVFALLAHGRSNSEIAGALVLGEPTVKTHVARVLTKLGLRDRVQAVVFAYETGYLIPGEEPSAT